MRNYIKGFVGILVLAVAIFLLLQMAVGSYSVNNESMQPGLQMGEILLINKMAYNFSEPTRGEIVYYKSPEASLDQLKRVIGIPGDVIEIKNNAVYVNGIVLTEPYVKDPPAYTLPPYQVLPDNYFVMEDNRNNSHGSSADWTISRENVIGRAWIFSWPPDKWGTVDGYPLDSELASSQLP